MAFLLTLATGLLLTCPDNPQPCARCGKAAALLVPRLVGVRTEWVCLGCSGAAA